MKHSIVADTGALISLAIMDLLPHINQLLGQVYVPDKVIEEIQAGINMTGTNAINRALNKGWLIQQSITENDLLIELNKSLDAGEAQAICFAINKNYYILIDEKKGRKVAKRYQLKVVGSLAVLLQAKENNLIPLVKPLLLKLKEHGYYISEKLIRQILQKANE